MLLTVGQLERIGQRLREAVGTDRLIIGVGFEHGINHLVSSVDELEKLPNGPGKRVTSMTLLAREYERRAELSVADFCENNIRVKVDELPEESSEALVADVRSILSESKPWYAAAWTHPFTTAVFVSMVFGAPVALTLLRWLREQASSDGLLLGIAVGVGVGIAVQRCWSFFRDVLFSTMRVLVGEERKRRANLPRKLKWGAALIFTVLLSPAIYDLVKWLTVG